MKTPTRLSDNEKWQAVVRCDKSCDGIFFYGVKTTGIFCRPSCRAKTPARANVVFFADAASATEAGFRICKNCRPDEVIFEPDLELVKKAKDIFDANYDQSMEPNYISKQLGVSTNHLVRSFKQHSGLTPSQYITKLRVGRAAELLEQEDINILEIACITGFKNLSNFYKCFRGEFGHTPNKHRKSRGYLQCRSISMNLTSVKSV